MKMQHFSCLSQQYFSLGGMIEICNFIVFIIYRKKNTSRSLDSKYHSFVAKAFMDCTFLGTKRKYEN